MSELIEKYSWLPVAEIASEVNSALNTKPRLVITAPPGAGKSTLLPLTILESIESGNIIMLEPRRIAAKQVAIRMAEMLGEPIGKTIGYKIRFESKVSSDTRIIVVTEGILERMLIDDPTLDGTSVIIFDEFHERSLASDLALALTRESQNIIRPDLKLLIMSATIDAESICKQFDATLIESKGRMYDVEVNYSEDYNHINCSEVVAKMINLAHKQHPGDILAFLPGQGEILKCKEILSDSLGSTEIIPLYGMLSPDLQRRALFRNEMGRRRVVLATPIAETSLTIEGIKIVVDSGLYKTTTYDPSIGLSKLTIARISKDMARQRAGRAGRTSKGVCYRLWSKATENRMKECREPEILDADLSSAILEIAAWGDNNPSGLPWITTPPLGHIKEAIKSLTALNAIDKKGNITNLGKQISKLPCHPRVAKMLISAQSDELKSLACDIAAIFEEKDPLSSTNNADITNRIEMLCSLRKKNNLGRWKRIADISHQYRRIIAAKECNKYTNSYLSGLLIASAFPERIAQKSNNSTYRMANGEYVQLNANDDLETNEYLAIAFVGSRIFLASPLLKDDVVNLGNWHYNVTWDSRQGKIIARNELRIGVLIVATKNIEEDISQTIIEKICEAAKKEGKSMFTFDDNVQRLQQRISTVREWHPEMDIPDVTTDSIIGKVNEWLPLYIERATSSAELRKIDMQQVIWGLLTYEQQINIDRIAPERLKLPCGRSVKIDYRQATEAPVVSARLQDCFGLLDTPRIDDGKRQLLMELLSPGFKPVQLTQDIKGFWGSTYFEVRKELRRRYPKHKWPEDPINFEN